VISIIPDNKTGITIIGYSEKPFIRNIQEIGNDTILIHIKTDVYAFTFPVASTAALIGKLSISIRESINIHLQKGIVYSGGFFIHNKRTVGNSIIRGNAIIYIKK
jgi:hypothetical protein